jgi:C4-dicarboxylate-specific signal transduction histidine kinase
MVRDDVDVYWDSPADEPLCMAGPEMPYEYLIRELLTNAISAVTGRDQAGMVWLSLSAADDGSAAELTVSDNGPGFPADFRAAFEKHEPLYRTERPSHGYGFHKLRLYAEARGATYRLGERPEGGAIVMVCLPLILGMEA